MKRAWIWVIIIIVVVGALILLRLWQIQKAREALTEMIGRANTENVVPVIVAPVTTGDVERIVRYTGTAEPKEKVQVHPKVAGRIVSIAVDEGDAVKKDDRIAVIDPEITGQRFEPYEVPSPIGGKISEVFLDVGSLVNQAQPIVEVIDDSSVKVEIGVLEKDYHVIKEGTPVRMEFEALPGTTIDARVSNRSPVVDARTGTAKTEIVLKNNDGRVKPGMFARVQVITEVRKGAVLMPLAATLTEVLPGRGTRVETTVYVAEGDVARARPVVLGLAGPTHYEVLEGLKPGEAVVVTGQNLLRDGTKIQVTEDRQ
jgi:multidrug efflux pump subunit AcrA (membrane-fusion protein)